MRSPIRAARRRRAALRKIAVAVLLAIPLGSSGCWRDRPAESPEDAFQRVIDACSAADAARLFDALDTRTQWAIETVHGAQREMRQLIITRYPPEERDRALARLPAACEEELERPRRYYRRLDDSAAVLADLDRRLHLGTGQPVGSVRKREGIAEVWREGGSIFHFYRDDKGRWGFMELRDGWERAKERALHEVETVKANAALYQQRRQPPAATASHGSDKTP